MIHMVRMLVTVTDFNIFEVLRNLIKFYQHKERKKSQKQIFKKFVFWVCIYCVHGWSCA